MAQTAETSMTMDNLNLFPEDNISKHRKEGEDSWKGRFTVDNVERNVIDFETVCQVSDACSSFIRMRDDDNLVPTIYQLAR